MIIPGIQKLLKSKYVGSRVIITREKTCIDNKITIMVQVKEEYLDQVDTIQGEVKSITKVAFDKILPVIER
jgi:hypothetical protein